MKFLNFLVLLLVLVPCMAANGITNAEKTLAVHNATSYQATYNAEIPTRPSLYRRVTNQVSALVESDAATKALRMLDIRKFARKAYFGLAELVQSFMESYSELFSKRISDGKKDGDRAADAKVFAQNSISTQSLPTNENDSGMVDMMVIDGIEIDFAEIKADTESACSTQSAANENSAESVALATIEQTSTIQALETPQQSQRSRSHHAEEGGLVELISLLIIYRLFRGTVRIVNRIRVRTIRRTARKIRAILSALLASKPAIVEGQPTSNWEFPTESQYVFDIVHIDLTRKFQALVDYEPVLNSSDIDAALREGSRYDYYGELLKKAKLEQPALSPPLECETITIPNDQIPGFQGMIDDAPVFDANDLYATLRDSFRNDYWIALLGVVGNESSLDASDLDAPSDLGAPEHEGSSDHEEDPEDPKYDPLMLPASMMQPTLNYEFDMIPEDHTESQGITDYEPVLNSSDAEAVLHECFENGYCGEPLTFATIERLLQSPTLECSFGHANNEIPEDEKRSDADAEQHQDSTPQQLEPEQPEPEQNVNEEETMERISGSDTGNEEPCLGASNVSDEVLIDEFAPEIYRVNWGGNALEIFGDSQRALSSYHYGATDITEQAWALGKFLPSIHQISSAVGLYLPEINALEGALEYIKDLELKYDPGFDTGRIEKLYSRVHSLNLSQQEIEGKDLIGLTEEIVFAANLYCSGRLKHRHSRVRYQRRVRKTYEKVTAIVKKNVEALECATEAPESIINEYCDIVGELECKICTDELFRQLYADKLD